MQQMQVLVVYCLILILAFTKAAFAADLQSWNDGPAKQSIVEFVSKVVKPGRPDFVPAADVVIRIDGKEAVKGTVPRRRCSLSPRTTRST